MSKRIDDGGPAYPVVRMPLDPDTIMNRPGMSLRDWFAGQALAGFASSWYDRHKDDPATQRGAGPSEIAAAAYAHADAMIAARKATE